MTNTEMALKMWEHNWSAIWHIFVELYIISLYIQPYHLAFFTEVMENRVCRPWGWRFVRHSRNPYPDLRSFLGGWVFLFGTDSQSPAVGSVVQVGGFLDKSSQRDSPCTYIFCSVKWLYVCYVLWSLENHFHVWITVFLSIRLCSYRLELLEGNCHA